MERTVEDLIPLRSLEAEMGVLGSMLLSARAAEEGAGLLSEEDFYQPAHQEVYRAMLQLIRSGKAVDILTLRSELEARGTLQQVGGVDYLVQVMESVPSAANAIPYARIVLEKSTLRRLETAGRTIAGLARSPEIPDVDGKVDEAERLIYEVGSKRLGKDFQAVGTLATEFFRDIDQIMETGEPMTGVHSGFYSLDEMTTGFYPGDLVIVAARPSMGKTALVLNFALNVARTRKGPVAIFSLEMSGAQLVRRLVSMISGVRGDVLKSTHITDEQYTKIVDACEELSTLPIYIDDSSEINGLEIKGKCRRLQQQHGELALIVVDYLQLMRATRKVENRVQEVGEIARSLKAVAKDLSVPVVALSQLSRSVETREGRKPQLSDLRESGSIEAEADLVMFIFREDYYKPKEERAQELVNENVAQEAEIIIAKHRNGPTGTVKVGFQPAFARFVNLKV
ncbi:MAG: replicative DNA helicase [Armatimonadetes bacterium]|nr:replicative DNA helicase [Armatimonadota bacterium]